MDKKMLDKCLSWFGKEVTEKNVSVAHKVDEEDYHQRVYLVAWNNEKGFTEAYVIRVFTNCGSLGLSQDYNTQVPVAEFVDKLPEIMDKISAVKA